ncbi:hypothetical protein AGMMS49959_18820 [Planctomycetales bacterium]|nr:hypothetical protein AGMMS49959_18820 [Planctomycetales bacterium]
MNNKLSQPEQPPMTPSTNRIEYKQDLGDDLEQEAVAFLNSGGGDIVIGVCKDDGFFISQPRSRP